MSNSDWWTANSCTMYVVGVTFFGLVTRHWLPWPLILFKRSIKMSEKWHTIIPNRQNRTYCFILVSKNAINIIHAKSTGMQRPLYLIQPWSRPFCGGGRVKPVGYWELWFWNNKHPICPNSFWAKWEALFISGIVPWGHLIPSGELFVQVWTHPRDTGDALVACHQSHVQRWDEMHKVTSRWGRHAAKGQPVRT